MCIHLIIRPEVSSDRVAIKSVINAAFAGMPYAEGDEAELVDDLRHAMALPVSLVAVLNDAVIGHIAFSPAYSSDNTSGWYALGPLAVLPQHQHTGVGSTLMHKGLEAIASLSARGCILVGHPQFYLRFGFEHAPDNAPENEPVEYFMVKLFYGQLPLGPIYFHEAFKHAA